MAFAGRDVIDIGSTRVGQKYILGAQVPLNNPNWKGPWDCAEFTSWCAYQAYGLIFGAGNVTKVAKAEPYSGHWYDDARKRGTVITWKEALKIPGAALIRAPADGKIGHVAFAIGDGNKTLEARGAAFGVGIFGNAARRAWTIGCLLPNVDYTGAPKAVKPAPPTTTKPKPEPISMPPGYLWLNEPNLKGAEIVALQRALAAKQVDPGPVDGEYGPMTHAAVTSFQLMKGLEVDGVLGPSTAEALGLSFPITPTAKDEAIFKDITSPKGPAKIPLPPPAAAAAAGAFDGITGITQSGRSYKAKCASGFAFTVGTTTRFTDDMHRTGLFNSTAAKTFGAYTAADFTPAFGQWAHFIEPTLIAEGGGRFATLNTYDRAAFTFGAPQFAAHTPGQNFIILLRELLTLPDADKHFPELSLRSTSSGKKTVHLKTNGGFQNLEAIAQVTRPNGRTEKQLANLMKYLNPSPGDIDANELSAAARLMNWLRLDPKAKELQIKVFIDHAKDKLAEAKRKVAGFDGRDWRIALWILDIRHQGRGTFAEMSAAVGAPDPQAALKAIGWPKYKGRIKTVDAAVTKLASSGVLNGFRV
jgi:peptidoglycan hydrolase-like protein with peptidoglycan-binding domain